MRTRLHVLHVPGVDAGRDAIVARLRDQADACVHEDPDRHGCMWNWLQCLACAKATDGGLAWSLILSDDADPLPGWQSHLVSAEHYSPQPVLGLTHFGGYGAKILAKGAPYGVGDYLLWGGAIAYRRDFLTGLAEWAPRVVAQTGYPHDDVLVTAYAKRIGVETAMLARAIFDQPVQASLLNHNTKIRRPAATIMNRMGPSYGSLPRFVRVHRSGGAEDMAMLAQKGDA